VTDTALRPRSGPRLTADDHARRSTRRGRLAIGIAATALVAIVGTTIVLGLAGSGGQALGPSSTQPDGAKALVSVLRQQGVRVLETSTLEATEKAAGQDPAATTVLAYDSGPYLTKADWARLAGLGAHTVAVTPEQSALDAVAPGVTAGSSMTGAVSPQCDLPALAKVRSVTGDGTRYTLSRAARADDTACLPAASGGGFGLVQAGDVTVLGSSSLLTNQAIVDRDNAALALTLLGDSSTLVWYLPSIDDLPSGGGTLASLTPGWVTPGIALLAAAAVAGAVWRGRRLGPLVVENLPVVVRSTETTEGRARLYERSASRTHALDQIRIGTIGRLKRLTGLPRPATVDDVVFRVAGLTGTDAREIRRVLVDETPSDDRQLVALSDSLRDLEAATGRAVAAR
jgi:hypothetical protein